LLPFLHLADKSRIPKITLQFRCPKLDVNHFISIASPRKRGAENNVRDGQGDALFAMHPRGKVFKTVDGEKWQLVATPKMPPPTRGDVRPDVGRRSNWSVPRQVRLVHGVLYSSSYPPTKLARSHDGGKAWESLNNNDDWHFKAYAYGPLAGGAPPKTPSK
jgi:hypothetical protein